MQPHPVSLFHHRQSAGLPGNRNLFSQWNKTGGRYHHELPNSKRDDLLRDLRRRETDCHAPRLFAGYRLMMGCMEPVFTSRSGYQRIYPDLPGMGKSDAPGWIDSTDHMLEAVLEFIRKIIPHGNFLIAGESYGGCLSRGILYKMQNRVDGLLLICPVMVQTHETAPFLSIPK